jgi:DHA3 family tetracycline resistance protein-like MFS transporter
MLDRSRVLVDPGRLFLALEAADGLVSALVFTLNLLYQAVVVGLTPFQLVLVGTVLEIAAFIAEVPTGIVADRRSRRLAVVLGYLLVGAGFVLEGAVPAFWAVLAAQVVWGTGAAFTSGALQAWVVDETGEDRAETLFLRGAQLAQVAAIGGIGLSVVLGWGTPRVPVIVGGVVWMAIGVVLWFLMPEDGFVPAPREEMTTVQSLVAGGRDGLRVVRAVPLLGALVLAELFSGLSSEALDRLWTPHLLAIGLPSAPRPVVWFGLIAVAGMAASVLAIEVARRRVSGHCDRVVARAMVALVALQVGAIAVFALAGSFVLAVAAWWALGLLRRVQGPVLSGWSNRHIPSATRATVLSLQAQANALGQIVGGPICGAVASAVSLRAGLALAGAFLAPAVAVLARYRRRLASAPAVE